MDAIASIFFALWITQDVEGYYHCTTIVAGTIITHHVRTPSCFEEWQRSLRAGQQDHICRPSAYDQCRQALTEEEQAYVHHLSRTCPCGLQADQWLDAEGRCFSENWVCPWCESGLPSHVCPCKDDEVAEIADPVAVALFMARSRIARTKRKQKSTIGSKEEDFELSFSFDILKRIEGR